MARSFNGSTDQINTGFSFPQTSALTMAGWVYATSLPNAYTIAFSLANSAAGPYFLIYVKSTGALATYCNCLASGTLSDPWPGGSVPTGAWTHLALSSTNNGTTFGYVNGVQQLTKPAGANVAGANFQMGMGYDLSGQPNRQWNGRIADVAVWSAQLTAAEILALATGVRPGKVRPNSFQAWWPLDGLVSPEPDLSGNAINGTLTGTAFTTGPPIGLLNPKLQFFLPPTGAGPTPFAFTQVGAAITRRILSVGY